MPITTTHTDYKSRSAQWERCRDCADGSDAVKAKGTRYLPRLMEQKESDYNAYVQRALFYGATGRTVQGLIGAVFRKKPSVIIPTQYEYLAEDITYSGRSTLEFARTTEEEVLITGRVGILVDAAEGEADRAYATLYTAESITNWHETRVDGEVKLIRVVLKETHTEENPTDPYDPENIDQYRELYIADEIYTQNIWRKKKGATNNDEGDNWEVVETIIPERSGLPMDFIPFVFLNAYSMEAETGKPPLVDLVDVNLSHYRSSADLEHGAHFTALPTPYAGGFNTDKDFYIGSTKAWVSDTDQIKVGFLEYTGQGLSAIVELMGRKEYLMSVLGARLLEEPKKGVESADTHKMRRSGEEGSLLAIVGTTSEAITHALRWIVWWSGADETTTNGVEVELNRDFVNTQIDPQYMAQLMKARQTGEISQETFLYNLQRGEVFAPGRTIEEEQDAIEDDTEDDMPKIPPGGNITPFPGQVPGDQSVEEDQ